MIFILVVGAQNNVAKELFIGTANDSANSAAIAKHESLSKQYDTKDFDIILGCADTIDEIKKAFPEIIGWDTLKEQPI